MNIGDLSIRTLKQQLAKEGIYFSIGPFTIHAQSSLSDVAEGIHSLYSHYPLSENIFADFHVRIKTPSSLRRWFRPQCIFEFDGHKPFKPLPKQHGFAFFEWGLNWCISQYAHQYLIIHAAIVEKNGKALIMPGSPGSGKSTLCAAMVHRGWRLLSDELTLIPLFSQKAIPIPRPISLKNESINVISEFDSSVTMGKLIKDTKKGDIAHVKPLPEHLFKSTESALPSWIIFPKYQPEAATELTPKSKAQCFMSLIAESFNYTILAEKGFDTISQLVEQCDCYDFAYSQLNEAIELFDSLENI